MFQRPDPNSSAQDLIRDITQQLGELEQMLWAQQEMIHQNGIVLPTTMLEQLAALRAASETLRPSVLRAANELDDLRALAATTRLINSSLDEDSVLNEVMDTAIELTGAERGYIVLRDRATGELRFRVARNAEREDLDASRFTVSQTVVEEVARTGTPIVAQNALLDPRLSMHDSIITHAPRSILCVPLMVKGRVTGVLYADNQQVPDLFGDDDLTLLMGFAAQAAIALENARLFDQQRRALAEVSELRELMDNVLASIASGVITLDRTGRILIFNQAAETILGVAAEDALGRSLREVLPAIHAAIEPLAAAVIDQGQPQAIEVEAEVGDRGTLTLSLKLTPLRNAHGLTVGMALALDDLTALKQRDATLDLVRTYLPPSLVSNILDIEDLGLGGTEREISILIADVRGFTTFSELIPPEELMATINRYLAVSTDALQLFDGIIDKYLGDAVIGLFNTPLNPQDDHAERAVRAALTMAYDVRALHEILPPEHRIGYGIGVATGTAIIGSLGSPDRRVFTALGPPVTLARLLQENALAGEIIISAATYEQVQPLFDAESIPPRKRREGLMLPTMYRVRGVRRRETAHG